MKPYGNSEACVAGVAWNDDTAVTHVLNVT